MSGATRLVIGETKSQSRVYPFSKIAPFYLKVIRHLVCCHCFIMKYLRCTDKYRERNWWTPTSRVLRFNRYGPSWRLCLALKRVFWCYWLPVWSVSIRWSQAVAWFQSFTYLPCSIFRLIPEWGVLKSSAVFVGLSRSLFRYVKFCLKNI